ncbi:DUF4129 domain-containing protein [Iamia sp. SCSIO 61187]|uniref:DUF4129 domain-containing protein n=1 Tax=Iamia sp. SCSIO 61187 TaxID=2722752 RepID=UPI001C628FC6|nr:DUF4129 domain-containing protein [Iamia sp. SCSIO 61187]QYG92388.1 DUF4129 domain-containing protein [Iamia sp. SCSIO 61187]
MAEVDPGQAREQARQVLEGDRYRARDVPRPLEGVLRWVGERVQDVLGPVGDALDTPAGLITALLVVTAATAAVVVAAIRRRTRHAEHREHARRRQHSLDPATLEHEAERAEADGDLEAAVRLRFRAGVLRLEQAGAVPARADATTARLVGRVHAPAFAGLARAFDEVAYGGRPATADDVARARAEWPAVVAAATREPAAAAPPGASPPGGDAR